MSSYEQAVENDWTNFTQLDRATYETLHVFSRRIMTVWGYLRLSIRFQSFSTVAAADRKWCFRVVHSVADMFSPRIAIIWVWPSWVVFFQDGRSKPRVVFCCTFLGRILGFLSDLNFLSLAQHGSIKRRIWTIIGEITKIIDSSHVYPPILKKSTFLQSTDDPLPTSDMAAVNRK